MPVEVTWDNDSHTTIRYEFVGTWTWDEVHQAVARGYMALDEVGHVVDAILDFRHSASFPTNAIAQTRHFVANQHPLAGVTIFVGASPLFRSLWAMFKRVYGLFIRQKEAVFLFADSVDDARAMLAKKESQG